MLHLFGSLLLIAALIKAGRWHQYGYHGYWKAHCINWNYTCPADPGATVLKGLGMNVTPASLAGFGGGRKSKEGGRRREVREEGRNEVVICSRTSLRTAPPARISRSRSCLDIS